MTLPCRIVPDLVLYSHGSSDRHRWGARFLLSCEGLAPAQTPSGCLFWESCRLLQLLEHCPRDSLFREYPRGKWAFANVLIQTSTKKWICSPTNGLRLTGNSSLPPHNQEVTGSIPRGGTKYQITSKLLNFSLELPLCVDKKIQNKSTRRFHFDFLF